MKDNGLYDETDRNFYDILGVKKNATETDIRSAYIRESLKSHPDRNDSPDATIEFQQVANAYYVLRFFELSLTGQRPRTTDGI
jgi:DnaJ-class molecular chaperone